MLNSRKLITQKFISLGADPHLLNKKGQGLLHLAAGTGNVYLLAYFHKSLHLDFNKQDCSGKTPLHTAAFEGQDQTASVLISWTEDMNICDKEKLTPLHLAAYSTNYRIVRHLLMKGSDRKAKDISDSTPLDIGINMHAPNDILQMLKEPTYLQKINYIKPPLLKVKKSYTLFYIFILTFIARYLILFLLILPSNIYSGTNIILKMISFTSCILNCCCSVHVSNRNPGYAVKDPNIDLIELYEKYNPDYVCPYCEVRRTHDVKHCQNCSKCVKQFDHHCPWIHNCVGIK